MADEFAVDIEACRGRQQRLIEQLEQLDLDCALLTNPKSVQWLTGLYLGPLFTSAVAIDSRGLVTLAVPSHVNGDSIAADEVIAFDAQLHATLTEDPAYRCTQALLSHFTRLPQKVGCEYSSFNGHWSSACDAQWVDLEAVVLRLRRCKDSDELRMLARANNANRAMYDFARQNIEPGINELDLYNALYSVAVRELGEPLTYFGHDFQCCSIGGPPRDRNAETGELFILDLGVGFRGFHSDNSRTFIVGDHVSDPQRQAWQALMGVFEMVQSTVKPGVSCVQLYRDVQELLVPHQSWVFAHHLGHGVGYSAHEAPRLNPEWDDHFEQGDFFTVEPGMYHEELRYGMRLEQNYLVTGSGVKLMTDWPIEL